jgi:hypothetical protein
MKGTPSLLPERAAIDEFLSDLGIALGHAYEKPGHVLFQNSFPGFEEAPTDDLVLVERFKYAYERLDASHKEKARGIVREALLRCAKEPLGLRRSLACVDVAHLIYPELSSEPAYSKLLLRNTQEDQGELAEWLWQLVRRWHKWNVKVVPGSPAVWETAAKAIAPKGILTLLMYLDAQRFWHEYGSLLHEHAYPWWGTLCEVSLNRVNSEKEALLSVGQEPRIARKRIKELRYSYTKEIDDKIDGCIRKKKISPSSHEGLKRLLGDVLPSRQSPPPGLLAA